MCGCGAGDNGGGEWERATADSADGCVRRRKSEEEEKEEGRDLEGG
jgi:hypothetical protein